MREKIFLRYRFSFATRSKANNIFSFAMMNIHSQYASTGAAFMSEFCAEFLLNKQCFVVIHWPSGIQMAEYLCRRPFLFFRKCVFRFLALIIIIRVKIAAPLTIEKYNCYFECEWRKHILRPDNVLLWQSACISQYLDFAEEQQETNRRRKNIKIDKKYFAVISTHFPSGVTFRSKLTTLEAIQLSIIFFLFTLD